MQEDWGKYSQEPWMTGGTWKDAKASASPKKPKAKKRPARISTKHKSTQDDKEKFQAEVDLADLQIQLRRWTFARSWRRPSSKSLTEDLPISPRTRQPTDVGEPATSPRTDKASLCADQVENQRNEHEDHAALSSCHQVDPIIAKADLLLDRHLIGQYLDRCIAATESQLAGERDKTKKKGAVKEIERLVEKVIETQAILASEKV